MLRLNKTKLLVLFIFILLLIDFFIVGNLDSVCRHRDGYGFKYPVNLTLAETQQMRYGSGRIIYNFTKFFIFWAQLPMGKSIANLRDFLILDVPPSSLEWNITHFFAFLSLAILLYRFFKLSWWQILIIGMFINVFHEYVAEGICLDPSLNDLWIDSLGLLVGILVWKSWPLIKAWTIKIRKKYYV